jgi:predicted transcriptional regulator
LPEKFEVATLGEVSVAMAINEKLAGVCFPGSDGKLDFGVGFVGSDDPFRKWCSDLFQHYWTSSDSVRL